MISLYSFGAILVGIVMLGFVLSVWVESLKSVDKKSANYSEQLFDLFGATLIALFAIVLVIIGLMDIFFPSYLPF